MQDLEGYRIRIGKLKHNIMLHKGQQVYLARGIMQKEDNVLPFDYKGSFAGINSQDLVFIDDGFIVLRVQRVFKDKIKAVVVRGGEVLSHKGVNMPYSKLEFDAFTETDREDLKFGINLGVDFIAQSFVRSKKDIDTLKKHIPAGFKGKIIAKIENRQALANLPSIIKAVDGVIVARGDMGVSFPIYRVALLQKDIIRECKKQRRFVIVATQMLESMRENILPTRAEVADITNAIIDGADALLLSAEKAVGKYPLEAVKTMCEIIKTTERSIYYGRR